MCVETPSIKTPDKPVRADSLYLCGSHAASSGPAQTVASELQRPTLAFTLALIGVMLQAVGLLFVAFLGAYALHSYYLVGPMMGYWGMMGYMMGYWGAYPFPGYYAIGLWWFGTFVVLGIVALVLGAYGTALLNSTEQAKIRTGSVLLLVSAILGFPSMWGFFVGSALLFAASIVGLLWRP